MPGCARGGVPEIEATKELGVPNFLIRKGLIAAAVLLMAAGGAARASTDETTAGVNPSTIGMQPLRGAIPAATPVPGESRVVRRGDGTFAAVADVRGRTRTFHLVERDAPWTLQPGLTVLAKTYNGVVPGPTLIVHQGDRVIVDYRNEQSVPDTVHFHGIHEIPVSMDGVAGISQPLVMQHGSYRYVFTADAPGTFIYHTHDNEEMLNSGLYGALVVLPAHASPAERADRDDVEVLSSWAIQSLSENHFTINGKEYPYTTPINVRSGQRIRIRWINISGENMHTMHTHGHYQRIIARDAQPVTYRDIEDTVLLGPGQRVDVLIDANQRPGTWIVHCHVIDHTEDATGMPDGLVTAIHYEGTPNTLAAMNGAMRRMLPSFGSGPLGALPFGWTIALGAIAGLTIFLGLPVARMRNVSPATIAALNAIAIGILVYLVVEIAGSATAPLVQAARFWHGGGAPLGVIELAAAYVGGLFLGLVGLGILASRLSSRAASGVHDPLLLAAIIAIGIGAHNFAEGLAIGASAVSGATAIAVGLIIGFALHNATEGFGIAAPLSGRVVPSWGQLALAGIVAGGPTFLGTVVGYSFQSPILSVLFLATAIGALVFVIGELWAVLRRNLGITPLVTSMLACGFLIALTTEIVLDLNGG